MKITKDINISELIEKHPEVIPVLLSHGLSCVGCPFATQETLAQGAEVHGFGDEETEELIKEINLTIEKGAS